MTAFTTAAAVACSINTQLRTRPVWVGDKGWMVLWTEGTAWPAN